MKEIPVYPTKAGKISDARYDGGTGLFDERKIDEPDVIPHFTDGMSVSEAGFRDLLTQLDEDNVFYHYQYAPAGSISVRLPSFKQRNVNLIWRDSAVRIYIEDDYRPDEDAPHESIVTVTGTDEAEFEAYLALVEKEGFVPVWNHRREQNRFAEFTADGGVLRCQFLGNTGTARIIADPVSEPISSFGDGEASGLPEVWQYGLHHAKNRGGFSMDCGMCYLIRLPDGSVFMTDGANIEQVTEEAANGLWDLLCRIGMGEDGKIRLNWFCTHAHSDHMDLFAHLLLLHHDEIELERVMFNFPSRENYGMQPDTYMMINRVRQYYPMVRYRKLHMGDRFTLGGCLIDVLQTHEESTAEAGNEVIGGFNDTSTVLRIHLDPSDETGNTDFLILGDIDNSAEKILMTNWKELHAGMVQTAHHLFNKLDFLYDAIDADLALVPAMDKCRWNHDKAKYDVVARTVPYEGFWFSDCGTDSFAAKDGKIVHLTHEPRHGGVYDGTLL